MDVNDSIIYLVFVFSEVIIWAGQRETILSRKLLWQRHFGTSASLKHTAYVSINPIKFIM